MLRRLTVTQRETDMWQILFSVLISAGMIFGAQNYTEQHKLGASQPISALTAKTSLSGNDTLVIVDNDSVATTKKITVTNASTSFKTYNDLTYSSKFTTSAGLASLLSDETGSSGGFVRAGSPTLDTVTITTSANITAPTFDVAGTDATGDIWYRNSGGLVTRLAAGNTNDYLRISGGLPAWTATSTIFPSQTSQSGKFLATDGTNISWGSAASAADYFSTTTSGTWTKPSLVNASSTVFVECWGGGGGGGGGTGGSTGRAGGGGGGGYFSRTFKASDLTSTVSITIGTGGTGGSIGTNNGQAGGNTTFGSYLTAYGGGGGGYGNGAGNNGAGGSGGGTPSAGTTGTNGGGATTGGGYGGSSSVSSDGWAGGFGAAFGGTNGGDSVHGGGGGGAGGTGGNSVFGGGAGGGGARSAGTSIFAGNGGAGGGTSCGISGGAGANGSSPAGGGGGACNDGSNYAGGNGAGGKCNVITYN